MESAIKVFLKWPFLPGSFSVLYSFADERTYLDPVTDPAQIPGPRAGTYEAVHHGFAHAKGEPVEYEGFWCGYYLKARFLKQAELCSTCPKALLFKT